eukprot:CAMPEP_0182586438 /NCGR_PEP_ID=MMETSP1324-20130603/62599_1 /TAXON_ID=236786 /ORGANISM="Florenciella sp., Strain RCC1587" /LENGTH=39 /DNA_ID= /DNA_START= /DNA_END= /DNA_ORIENTATION=
MHVAPDEAVVISVPTPPSPCSTARTLATTIATAVEATIS